TVSCASSSSVSSLKSSSRALTAFAYASSRRRVRPSPTRRTFSRTEATDALHFCSFGPTARRPDGRAPDGRLRRRYGHATCSAPTFGLPCLRGAWRTADGDRRLGGRHRRSHER